MSNERTLNALNRDNCLEFENNQSRNPITKRQIEMKRGKDSSGSRKYIWGEIRDKCDDIWINETNEENCEQFLEDDSVNHAAGTQVDRESSLYLRLKEKCTQRFKNLTDDNCYDFFRNNKKNPINNKDITKNSLGWNELDERCGDQLTYQIDEEKCKDFVKNRFEHPVLKRPLTQSNPLVQKIWKKCDTLLGNTILAPNFSFQRVETGGGGDCLYHSLAYVFGWGQYKGNDLREMLDSELSIETFLSLGTWGKENDEIIGHIAKSLIGDDEEIIFNPLYEQLKVGIKLNMDPQDEETISDSYQAIGLLEENEETDTDEYNELIKSIINIYLRSVNTDIDQDFIELVSEKLTTAYIDAVTNIKTQGAWGDNLVIALISKVNEINVIVYNDKIHNFYSATPIIHGWDCVFIYNFDNAHFQSLESTNVSERTGKPITIFKWEQALPILLNFMENPIENPYANNEDVAEINDQRDIEQLVYEI